MTLLSPRWRFALLLATRLVLMGAVLAPAPALAMQILEAADHAELAAEISATGVNRIALAGDRIARVVRSPDGYAVEHDAALGDLYLRPAVPADTSGRTVSPDPVTLFVGTERGFTYRLNLTPAARGSAQILIRNAAVPPDAGTAVPAGRDSPRVAALVRLVRAVARREPLAAYEIHAGLTRTPIRASGLSAAGLTPIETWRGPHFRALVFEAGRSAPTGGDGSAGLAGTIGGLPGAGRVAALWLAAPGTGPKGGRLVVAVMEAAAPGAPR